MSNDKLAEALRSLRLKFTSGNDVPVPEARITRAEWEALEQAHAAEAAQAQAHATNVPGELAEPIEGALNYEQELSYADGWNACREAMLAAAPQQAAEPVAWRVANHPQGPFDFRSRKPNGWAVMEPLYTHPQPARDAKDWTYAQCIEFMQVGLRNTQYASVRGAGPTVDEIRQGARAAMAKESGR